VDRDIVRKTMISNAASSSETNGSTAKRHARSEIQLLTAAKSRCCSIASSASLSQRGSIFAIVTRIIIASSQLAMKLSLKSHAESSILNPCSLFASSSHCNLPISPGSRSPVDQIKRTVAQTSCVLVPSSSSCGSGNHRQPVFLHRRQRYRRSRGVRVLHALAS
jgi:hypothetical protein